VNFEEYLISKKIDGEAFFKAEPVMFNTWKKEFEQMHPNSFTVQKLNLINPIRRKYQLKEVPIKSQVKDNEAAPKVSPVIPGGAKPVINPKPKFK
jgi:hypothetical protein